MSIKGYQINEMIKDKEVRVIDEKGAMLGVMLSEKAQDLALDRDLDLVKVSPDSNPPVCKIMDYGKFKYEQSRKEKESKKNQKVAEVKEIRTSVRVQEHDLNVKIKNIQKFLAEGDKVKISVRFRGREMAYTEKGRELLMKIKDILGDSCICDKQPAMEGRSYVMYLSPAGSKK
jgi:translation initiation factor IF-3